MEIKYFLRNGSFKLERNGYFEKEENIIYKEKVILDLFLLDDELIRIILNFYLNVIIVLFFSSS